MLFKTVIIALSLFAPFVQAQQQTGSNSIRIELPKTSFTKVNPNHEVEIPLVAIGDAVNSDQGYSAITNEHWDTTRYNPYKAVVTEYPFQIFFTDSTYASPVLHDNVITSRYGWRRGRPHQGIDIDLITGDSVVSVLAGIVRFAKYNRGLGKTVVVRHYNGLETTYAHLSHIEVKANDTLSKGQYLGKGGNTGNSRGSHLHFVVSYKGEPIHPEYVFDFSPNRKIRAKKLWVTMEWTRARFHNSRRLSNIKVIESKDAALSSLIKTKKIYIVKKGDTLYGISRRNRLSVRKICKTNSIKKTTPLKIGQKLVLEL